MSVKAILIQARMSSLRFPGKVLCNLFGGVSLIEFIYKRCLGSREAGVIAVITSDHQSDDALFEYCKGKGVKIFRGALENVLSRYIKACEFFKVDVVCRVCADSPFVNIELVDTMFRIQSEEDLEYLAPDKNNCIAGFDSEIVTYPALKRVSSQELMPEDCEHVTPYIRRNPDKFKSKIIAVNLRPPALKEISLTIDKPQDLVLCRKIAETLKAPNSFTSEDVLEILRNEDINAQISAENRD